MPRSHVRGLMEAEVRCRRRAYQLRLRLHWPPAFFVEDGTNVRGNAAFDDGEGKPPRQKRPREPKAPAVVTSREARGVKKWRAVERVAAFVASRHRSTISM